MNTEAGSVTAASDAETHSDEPISAEQPEENVCTLELRGLHVAFGGNRVLEGVNMSFTNGFNGLIGPNGAGKTTIFNVISGYVKPSQGEVLLGNKDIGKLKQTKRVAAGIGRTFQAPHLIPDATVIENALLGAHHVYRWGHLAELFKFPWSRSEERKMRIKSMELLDLFGLADLAHEETDSLPLGSQKIVEVARALVGSPSVVLLDEPAAGLGADDVTVLLRGLRSVLAERNLCIIIIEHDLKLVASLCPKIAVLDFGRIISEGSPDHVTHDPAVIEAYLGHGFAARLEAEEMSG